MSFEDAMKNILPPRNYNGRVYQPAVTYSDGIRQGFSAKRKGRIHQGVDFNYSGLGQKGINLMHPAVGSPVSGLVTDIRPEQGLIEIKDAQGYRHQIRHLNKVTVKIGNNVIAGQYIGDMGGMGPTGANEYAQHVHYSVLTQPDPKIKHDSGKFLDPEAFWSSHLYYTVMAGKLNHVPLESIYHLDPTTQNRFKGLSQGFNILSNGETLRREGNHVWRIKPNGSTRGYFLSE